ncbi:hypothetical protein C8Q78DRAFT_1038710 [Trametes maxima]|nr:hypothetical protein C8Q78DRAFT_1038710 [Trametes maxima]
MDDASLASDMIRLLRDELERVRAEIQEVRGVVRRSDSTSDSAMVNPEELYALQEENASLYREVESLRTEADQLEARCNNTARVNTEVRELEEERASRALNLKEELETLQRKLTAAEEKYTRCQKAHSDVLESVNDVERLLQETKTRRKEEKGRLKAMQTELEEKRAIRGFDPRQFLKEASSRDTVAGAPKEIIATSTLGFDLPKSLLDLCVPEGYLTKNSEEVVWPGGGKARSHCLSICSTHRYNPKLNEGQWEPSWDLRNQGKTMDFFDMEEQEWRYLGTYKKEGQTIIASSEIRGLVHAVCCTWHTRRRTLLTGTNSICITCSSELFSFPFLFLRCLQGSRKKCSMVAPSNLSAPAGIASGGIATLPKHYSAEEVRRQQWVGDPPSQELP